MPSYKPPPNRSKPDTVVTKPDIPAQLRHKHSKTASTKPKMPVPLADQMEPGLKEKKRNGDTLPSPETKKKSRGLYVLLIDDKLTTEKLRSIVDSLSSSNKSNRDTATKQLKKYIDSAEKARDVLSILPSVDHPTVSLVLIRNYCIKFIRKDL